MPSSLTAGSGIPADDPGVPATPVPEATPEPSITVHESDDGTQASSTGEVHDAFTASVAEPGLEDELEAIMSADYVAPAAPADVAPAAPADEACAPTVAAEPLAQLGPAARRTLAAAAAERRRGQVSAMATAAAMAAGLAATVARDAELQAEAAEAAAIASAFGSDESDSGQFCRRGSC